MSVSFNKSLCDQNPYCPAARVCPKRAMFIDRKTFRPTYDETKCTGCEICVSKCLRGAITSK